MKQTLIAASLVAVTVIVLVALATASNTLTGRFIDTATENSIATTFVLGFVCIGVTMAFLWNKPHLR